DRPKNRPNRVARAVSGQRSAVTGGRLFVESSMCPLAKEFESNRAGQGIALAYPSPTPKLEVGRLGA
ncbi:MAG: hypothetical protein KDI02_27620, partial [Anaerolineae bacterium]|nr:hypothetical protein [Anaerolineae bacterium]